MLSIATRENVFQAANELKRDGIKPTQSLIRERLGGGSMQTISNLLKEWREEDAQVPDIMDKVPDDIKGVMDKAYEGFVLQVWKATDSHLGREKQALSGELKSEKAEKERLNRIVHEYESTIDRLTRESAERHQMALAYAEDKRRLEVENQGLIESNRSLTVRLSEAQQEFTRADTERRFHAESSERLTSKVRELEDLLAATKTELADTRRDDLLKIQSLENEMRLNKANHALEVEEVKQTMARAMSSAAERIQDLEQQTRQQQAAAEQARVLRERQEQEIAELKGQMLSLETEKQALAASLSKQQADFNADSEAMRERLEQHTVQITSLDTQKKSLEISLANITKDLEQANSMVRELSDENIRVRAELGVQERIETLLRQHQREIPQ